MPNRLAAFMGLMCLILGWVPLFHAGMGAVIVLLAVRREGWRPLSDPRTLDLALTGLSGIGLAAAGLSWMASRPRLAALLTAAGAVAFHFTSLGFYMGL